MGKKNKAAGRMWPQVALALGILAFLSFLGFGPLLGSPSPGLKPTAQPLSGASPSPGLRTPRRRWTPKEIVDYMNAHPSRAYFAHLFSKGGFSNGIEVGVADGRFTEHILTVGKPKLWRMCEPFPNDALISRYPIAGGDLTPEQEQYRKDRGNQKKELASASWKDRGIDNGIELKLLKYFSTDKKMIDSVPKGSVDFVYLDGAHDYKYVKEELEPYWEMIAPGGVLAGHDYQNHGEKPLKCKGCEDIPKARPYTQFGIDHGKKKGGTAADMDKVTRAVQEWVVEEHPEVHLHHTMENFTRESLAADGLNFDLVITNTYNPSWYFVKESH
jgi:hypothetical protein